MTTHKSALRHWYISLQNQHTWTVTHIHRLQHHLFQTMFSIPSALRNCFPEGKADWMAPGTVSTPPPPSGTEGRGKKRKWEQDSGKETAPANHKVVLRFCAVVKKCLTSEKTRIQILLPHKADSWLKTFPASAELRLHTQLSSPSTHGRAGLLSHVTCMTQAHFYIILRHL